MDCQAAHAGLLPKCDASSGSPACFAATTREGNIVSTPFLPRTHRDRRTSSMIHDADTLPDGQPLNADLCIVGAGAAGISMALQFIGTNVNVLLLESGGVGEEPDTQALYAGSVADEHMH